MNNPHRCPICSRPSRISFLTEHESAIFEIHGREIVGLENLACRLYCVDCAWQLNGILHNVTINPRTMQVNGGTFIANS